MDRDPFDLVGDVLDTQFRVDAFVGEGDLSVVYKGHHLGVDAPIAIKCLNLPATLDGALVRPLVDSFKEAGRVHYRLARGNLNIAQSIASGSTLAPRTGALVPYLVREWFEGESLASELARRHTERRTGRSTDDAMALLEPVFDGVAYAHGQGVAHLSLNPSNLFLAARAGGASAALKVLDFGVARTMNDLVAGIGAGSAAAEGLRLLFPAYAAPEQLDKKVGAPGAWTDVYALALLVMELLSDRVVMSEGETGAVVERALDAKRRPTPQSHGLRLSHDLAQALSRAVSLEPQRRQKDAAELWRDLRAAAVRPRSAVLSPTQPRSPTLVGMGIPRPAVAGALGISPHSGSLPSMSTMPMAFEAASPPPAVILSPPPPLAVPPPAPSTSAHFALVAESPAPAPPLPRQWPLPLLQRRWPLPVRAEFLRTVRSPRARIVAIGSALVSAALILVVIALLLAPGPQAAAAALAAAQPPPLPPPEPPAVALESPAPQAADPFSPATAWRSLYVLSRDVARCRRSGVWGGTTATVTFSNDGSVGRVAFRPPFTGSATARCVAGVLESARVSPFGGRPGAVQFWFYVSQKP